MLFTLFRGPCGPDTAATVRRSLVELGALAGVSVAVAEDLALVLTEMVNNAVSAGAGAIHVALTEPPPHLQVHVTDDADGVPVLGDAATDDTHGRGLAIIQAIAAKWGYTTGTASKTVWARFPD